MGSDPTLFWYTPMKKIAVFVDWDNLRQTIASIQRKTQFREFNYNNPAHISAMIRSFLQPGESLYRIYFYTAPMPTVSEIRSVFENRSGSRSLLQRFDGWEETENGKKYCRNVQLSKNFLSQIVCEDYVALRLGRISVTGLKHNNYPDMNQKEVDMLFGLDISHVSYMKLADSVLLFSRDTDIVPAMKVARTQGLEVILPVFEESSNISEQLIKHSDVRRQRSLVEIYEKTIAQ